MTTPIPTPTMRLNVVLFRDPIEDAWFAQILEHDICGTGDTPGEATADLVEACNLELKLAVEQFGLVPGTLAHIPPPFPRPWGAVPRYTLDLFPIGDDAKPKLELVP